jgi:hypothetical protein
MILRKFLHKFDLMKKKKLLWNDFEEISSQNWFHEKTNYYFSFEMILRKFLHKFDFMKKKLKTILWNDFEEISSQNWFHGKTNYYFSFEMILRKFLHKIDFMKKLIIIFPLKCFWEISSQIWFNEKNNKNKNNKSFAMILRKFLHKFDFVKNFNYYFFFVPTDAEPSNPCNEFAFQDSVVLGWGLIMWLSWKKERTWDPSNSSNPTHTYKRTLVLHPNIWMNVLWMYENFVWWVGFIMSVGKFIQLINVGNGIRVSSQIFTLRIVNYIA